MASADHFEIPADDIKRAQAFYQNVLDFSYDPWDDQMGMLNQPDGEGINGDIHSRGTVPHPTVVFTVDRIEDVLEKVLANGGSQVGEIQSLSEMGRWVYITDSESNIIGLFEDQGDAV